MIFADELYLNNFRDVGETLVMQDAFDVFPALLAKLLISFKGLDLLVFVLEFL